MKMIGSLLGLGLAVGAMGAAEAVPAIGTAPGAAANGLNEVGQAQYVYRGYSYCYYSHGWHGSGWYQCGYAYIPGFGWGGINGWRGWYYGPHHRYYRRPYHPPHHRYY
jgi:hypothetical protein